VGEVEKDVEGIQKSINYFFVNFAEHIGTVAKAHRSNISTVIASKYRYI
jgi:hypothetical protein